MNLEINGRTLEMLKALTNEACLKILLTLYSRVMDFGTIAEKTGMDSRGVARTVRRPKTGLVTAHGFPLHGGLHRGR